MKTMSILQRLSMHRVEYKSTKRQLSIGDLFLGLLLVYLDALNLNILQQYYFLKINLSLKSFSKKPYVLTLSN